jgi:radical SAM superfamily enzyme YgiQ (UPF0313 family)
MKFLLVAVNAKYIHSNPAVYSLYAYSAGKYADMMEITEYTINQKKEEILAGIYERKPDAVGFSCYIWNRNIIGEILEDLPKVLPGADIWLGGPEVSFSAPEVLRRYPEVKGIMVGEGEVTFSEILEQYRREEPDFSDVAGLYLASGFTRQRDITDLSSLPFLYQKTETFANRIIYYESSRGCPYRCSYCLSAIDKTVRFRDMSLVKKELDFFLRACVSQVKFVDRTFNCGHEHAMEIWQYLHEKDNGITNFHFEIAADILRDDEIELLQKMRPGQVQLEIGVQSFNEDTLRAINRRMDKERLIHVVSEIRKNRNIHQHLDLIAGLPYEDYESFGNSFDAVYAMEPDQLQLGFLKVLSGAPIAQEIEEYGIAYTKQPPYEVLCTKWLSFADVIRLKKIEEMVELYYNSNQFVNTLRYMKKAFSSPFKMFEALAEYYEKHGFFVNSPSRAYRYKVLLDFATEADPGKDELYTELITYDLYLRENMKSRPEFCRSLTTETYKNFRHTFYREEEKTRRYLPDLSQYDSRQLSGITHLEPFSLPVWDAECLDHLEIGDSSGEEKYVLFDYTRKDPLTKEAFTIKLGNFLV